MTTSTEYTGQAAAAYDLGYRDALAGKNRAGGNGVLAMEAYAAGNRAGRDAPEPQVSAEAEQAARDLYSTDWDEGGTASIYLPDAIAAALLRQHGWRREQHGWRSPNGHKVWERGEALQLALTAAVYQVAQDEHADEGDRATAAAEAGEQPS